MDHAHKQAVAPPTRNAPCPCGSGRKYKRCCLKNAGRARSSQPIAAAAPEPVGARETRAAAKLTARTPGERQALDSAERRAKTTVDFDERTSFPELLRGVFGFLAPLRYTLLQPDDEGERPPEPGQNAYLDRFVALLGDARMAVADRDDHSYLKRLGFIAETPRLALALSLTADRPLFVYPSVWTTTSSVTGVQQTVAGALMHRYEPGGVEVFAMTEMTPFVVTHAPVAFTDNHTDALSGALRWRLGRAEPDFVRQDPLERALEREDAKLAVFALRWALGRRTPDAPLSAEEVRFHVSNYQTLEARFAEDPDALRAHLKLLYPPPRLPAEAIEQANEYLRREGAV